MEEFLTNKQARDVILHLQGLGRAPHLKIGSMGLYELICQLGYVQIDSIQWVERAHHMILFARNQTYRPSHLTALIERERLLFEHWTHDASIIPAQFYPYWKHRFKRREEKLIRQFNKWQGTGYQEYCAHLLDEIETKGEIRSRDLVSYKQSGKENAMWQWHDGKAALEFLWLKGDLCILRREGFQKIYGLAKQGMGEADFKKTVSCDELIDWACRSAIQRLGFGSVAEITNFWDLLTNAEVKDWLNDQDLKTVRLVMVTGAKGAVKEFWARGDILTLAHNLPCLPKRIRVLSPFDPVIRNRNRLSWLFGFDYRIEIYVPREKRQWGYYVFPLLEGNRLIGRIDMRAQRKNKALEVKKLWLEPGVKFSQSRQNLFQAELARQLKLVALDRVVYMKGALDDLA